MAEATPQWWREAVGYEIYVRSFADASGDGVGDLDGITRRLDYLTWLGVTVVWLTPFYPSPGHDGGYDVADYTDVDPAFGDVAAFERLVERAHDLGLRVFIDLVPNHTSSDHPWFKASRSSRDNPYRSWYHWRDGTADGHPPNNWISVFGGPAWTWDERTEQWWLHLFLPEQPDLNWDEPAVADAFDEILDAWFTRGIDGVRIDVAHGLVKHPDLPDLPEATSRSARTVGTSRAYASLEHIHDRDQDAVVDVYRRWRRRFDDAGAIALGEVYLDDPRRVWRYVGESDALHASFWFPLQQAGWSVDGLRRAIDEGLAAGRVGDVPGAATVWVTESHDVDRCASRFGGGPVGRRRALALTALTMFLPGVPFIYMGQELGLTDVVVPEDRVQDPIALRLGEAERGRDRSRVPMPWEPVAGMGFTEPDVEPWLPFGERTDADTVAVQREDEGSLLHAHRRLVQLRRAHPTLVEQPFQWLEADGDVLAYRRGPLLVAVNCGDDTATLTLDGRASLHWHAPGVDVVVEGASLVLPPDASAVLQLAGGA